jgi:N-acetylneuraminic acid mutarotase
MQVKAGPTQLAIESHDLPPLPEKIAGQCVGTVEDLLVVAGGSSWDKPPWAGGVKSWSDRIYALSPGSQEWKLIGHLPMPMGYGSAVQVGKELLCIGGQDAQQVYNTALLFKLETGAFTIQRLPDLPQPITNAGAALAGTKAYIVGGQHGVKPTDASAQIWSLDLADNSPSRNWKKEAAPPWQHSRILPIVAGCGSDLFVASGADLTTDEKGTPHRIYLNDAWILTPKNEWKRLADSPVPIAGAPSICDRNESVVIFGGDDGKLSDQVFTLKDEHPGFSHEIRVMDLHKDRWSSIPGLSASLATTGVTRWNDRYVIAGGEPQPGHRSDRVIAISIGE